MANANLKMCPACRGLIAAGDTVCSLCGAEARAGRQQSGAVETPMTVTVTGVIFTVNLVFYALSLLLSTKLSSGGAGGFSLEPDGDALALLGADYGSAVRAGEYWRVLTYAFLHGGVLHILMNSLALIQVGRLAEEVYGGAKYFCLYLFAALTGGIVIALTNNAAVGASGAVFGLIGAMAVYGYKRGDTFGHALKADMVQWLIYGAIISLSPRISFAGHLGGLIGGAGMAWFLDDQEQTLASQRRTGVWKSAAALGLVLTVAAFAMIGLRMRGELAGLQTGQQARMRQGGQRQLTDRFIFWRRNLRAAMAAMALTPGTGAENKTPAAPEKPATAVAEYKDLLARAIQLLEKTEDPDPESAAIRAKVLSLLHTHGEAVSRQTNAEGMVPSLASQGELVAVKKRYDAWVARMESELKIPRMETNTERGAEETAPDQGPRQEKNNRPQ